jgi:hypothetical protein
MEDNMKWILGGVAICAVVAVVWYVYDGKG